MALSIVDGVLSVTQFVDELLTVAVRVAANDIHIESYANRVRLRYRLDGVLTPVESGDFLKRNYAAVVSRIKVLASMDIAEHRLPQEGGFAFRCPHGEVDVRASVVPAVGGEKIALRLFTRSNRVLDFASLGLNAGQLATLEKFGAGQRGMILVAGPTGSGKTTTLYTLLQHINSPGIHVVTVEDPVERKLDGVNQCEVKEEINLSFARLLRAFLRQDPEVILVGEIRDGETADIAVKAAMTGHTVISTVHCENAAATVKRLSHLGVSPSSLATATELVIAQRLVRRVCGECVRRDEDWTDAKTSTRPFVYGAGCKHCAQTGYHGRVGVFELLQVDASVRRAMADDLDVEEIEIAAGDGFCSLSHNGERLLRDGVISMREFQRVFGRLPETVTRG